MAQLRRYVTTIDGISQPWSLLERRLDNLTIEEHLGGTAYIVAGDRR